VSVSIQTKEILMDYRDLLLRYINHVGRCEGVVFLWDGNRHEGDFSDEEWTELEKLDAEALSNLDKTR
jgi:hypothetical protein